MSDNYAVINGKRVELTDEQVRTLSVKTRANPFSEETTRYVFTIVEPDGVDAVPNSSELYDAALSFNDKQFAEQVALHQLLYRKLLKFAYDNGFEDVKEWDGNNMHWTIRYGGYINNFFAYSKRQYKAPDAYFSSKEATECAIEEVVKPFVKEHPEFVW